MRPNRSRRPRVTVVTLLLAPLVVATGACSGDDTVAVPDDRDGSSSTTVSPAGGDAEAYCATAREVAGQDGVDLSEDADAAYAGLQRMAADAPTELDDDFATFLDGVADIAQLDEDDPAALTGIFELLTDEDFTAAADAIERYTADQCGVELGAADPSSDDAGSGTGAADGIELEDIDAVKEANGSASWSEKLSTTVIDGAADVRVSSAEGELTAAEALSACEALLSALGPIDPQVTVEVAAGDTVLADSSGGTCATS